MIPTLSEEIKKVIEIYNGSLTKQEFLDAFKSLLDYLKKVEAKNVQNINQNGTPF